MIDGRVRRYPPDLFTRLWQHLEDLVDDARAVVAEEVLLELGKGSDDCHAWAKATSGLVAPATTDVVAVVQDITSAHPLWVSGTTNNADPWVIAHAAVRGWTVVTEERWGNSPDPAKVKIPNVCAGLGVPCVTFLDMARAERWQF